MLVVDDDNSVGAVVSAVFGAEGFDIVQAASAEAARAVIDEYGIDAVVLDHRLGGANGLDSWHSCGAIRPRSASR